MRLKINWNAHVHLDTADAQWVGLGWGVTDDEPGNPLDYEAVITVSAPPQAHARVGKQAPNETVVLISAPKLPCGNPIEIDVTYNVVSAKATAKGGRVDVDVAEYSGLLNPNSHKILAQASGKVGHDITVHAKVSGSCG